MVKNKLKKVKGKKKVMESEAKPEEEEEAPNQQEQQLLQQSSIQQEQTQQQQQQQQQQISTRQQNQIQPQPSVQQQNSNSNYQLVYTQELLQSCREFVSILQIREVKEAGVCESKSPLSSSSSSSRFFALIFGLIFLPPKVEEYRKYDRGAANSVGRIRSAVRLRE